jgi:hypothetical protein
MDSKSAAMFELRAKPEDIPTFWAEWTASPEHFAGRHFSWWPRSEAPTRVKEYVPNKELGDDFEDFKL